MITITQDGKIVIYINVKDGNRLRLTQKEFRSKIDTIIKYLAKRYNIEHTSIDVDYEDHWILPQIKLRISYYIEER